MQLLDLNISYMKAYGIQCINCNLCGLVAINLHMQQCGKGILWLICSEAGMKGNVNKQLL